MEEEPYIEFKNGQGPYISDSRLNQLQKLIKTDIKNQVLEGLKLAFPIGQPYITQTNTNPSTILGFGTWERVKGRVLVGLDEEDTDFNAIGKTGGSKNVTLTINQIPAHTHTYSITNQDGEEGWSKNGNWNSSGTHTTGSSGGGQAHNNLQPYEVVGYMWIRTA